MLTLERKKQTVWEIAMSEIARPERSLTALAPTFCALLGLPQPPTMPDRPLAPVLDDLGRVERLLVLLVDALGVETWMRHRARMPFVSALFARRLIPLESVIPTITPVCFATIASGVQPAIHQVADRQGAFAVPTIFTVLGQAGVDHCVVGRAKSSANLLYARFATRSRIARSNLDNRVEELVRDELRLGRARFLFCQLLDVDSAGHAGGPSGPESAEACTGTDARAARIFAVAGEAGYASLLIADHGQHDTGRDGGVRGAHNGVTYPGDLVVPCTWR